MLTKAKLVTVIAILLATIALNAASAQEATALPGGASSLQETHQDWRFTCLTADTTRHCAVSQQQVQQNGQRVLSSELQADADGGTIGGLVLPFGLLLDAGVTLQVDEQPVTETLRFQTCLPAGCVVRLTLDAKTVTALRTGKTPTVTGKTADINQEIPLAISLSGVAAALDRMAAFL